MNNPSRVIVDLPNCGMCNCLYAWARGYLTARASGAPLHVYGWNRFHLGPWIRRERIKRTYGRYFQSDNNLAVWLNYRISRIFAGAKIRSDINETQSNDPQNVEPQERSGLRVITMPWPTWPRVVEETDLFQPIRGHESEIRNGLLEMLQPEIRRMADKTPAPEISMHVRRGDYSQNTKRFTTPEDYFCETLRSIRKVAGENLPATVFSDAHPDELGAILQMPHTKLVEPQQDIVELLQMSKSRTAIVTSHGSTFGYWAGYLSQAAILLHPNHRTGRIRAESLALFEGTAEQFQSDLHHAEGSTAG